MQITASAVSLTVEDVPASSAFLTEYFGFRQEIAADGFASLTRDDAGMHVAFLRRGLEVLPDDQRDKHANRPALPKIPETRAATGPAKHGSPLPVTGACRSREDIARCPGSGVGTPSAGPGAPSRGRRPRYPANRTLRGGRRSHHRRAARAWQAAPPVRCRAPAWPSPRCCSASPANAAGSGSPAPGWATCFPTCRISPATTSGSRPPRRCWPQ